MSGYLQGQVWFRDVRGSERDVLLALADHADDDGTRIYPSMEYLAWKVGLKKRRTQEIVSSLRDRGVLIVVQEASRYEPTHYRMDLSALPAKPDRPESGVRSSASLPIRGAIQATSGVQSGDVRGAVQSAPEPSVETSKETSGRERAREAVDEVWAHFRSENPNGSRCTLTAERRLLIRNALKVRSVDECKLAITGMLNDEWYAARSITDIKYALRGGGRSPSPEATIDRLAAQAKAPRQSNGRRVFSPDGRTWDQLSSAERLAAQEAISMGLDPAQERSQNGQEELVVTGSFNASNFLDAE